MVLLDELGVDRERFINPTTSDELYSYVDEYLLGDEEQERLQLNKDLCDWARNDPLHINTKGAMNSKAVLCKDSTV